MIFITVSRTALVTMPAMLCVFAFLHLTRRSMIAVLGGFLVIAAVVWLASPNLRTHVKSAFTEYRAYETSDQATSVGLRLEFWNKSLQFFREAPLIGHGTGSVRSLFEQSAVGQTGVAAEIIANPHNQTLYTAVQWGVLGVAILYAMWFTHLLLFRGPSLTHWIGFLVVTQNMMTSLFNSHLFDFHEGWMYVLGVGVAGGMVLSTKATRRQSEQPS
jgi:O-antigen ligase